MQDGERMVRTMSLTTNQFELCNNPPGDKRGQFIPVGDPDKAALVMVKLADEPKPPFHLILGSEANAILEKANAARDAELQQWKSVSLSTDAGNVNSEEFLKTYFK